MSRNAKAFELLIIGGGLNHKGEIYILEVPVFAHIMLIDAQKYGLDALLQYNGTSLLC